MLGIEALKLEKTEKARAHKLAKKKRIPRELIYEMRYGKPIYYRDHEKVLAGEKALEEVTGSGALQWALIGMILKFLFFKLDMKKYTIATNEAGFKWAPRSWRNLDIAIFEREKVFPYLKENKYVPVAPQIVIEIDSKADLKRYGGELDLYMREKTQDLLEAGVKKVIWYTTMDKRVMVAEPEKRWYISSWNEDIVLVDGLVLNLEKLLAEEGIKL